MVSREERELVSYLKIINTSTNSSVFTSKGRTNWSMKVFFSYFITTDKDIRLKYVSYKDREDEAYQVNAEHWYKSKALTSKQMSDIRLCTAQSIRHFWDFLFAVWTEFHCLSSTDWDDLWWSCARHCARVCVHMFVCEDIYKHGDWEQEEAKALKVRAYRTFWQQFKKLILSHQWSKFWKPVPWSTMQYIHKFFFCAALVYLPRQEVIKHER